jgi:iron complex transport system substrate-binding protein
VQHEVTTFSAAFHERTPCFDFKRRQAENADRFSAQTGGTRRASMDITSHIRLCLLGALGIVCATASGCRSPSQQPTSAPRAAPERVVAFAPSSVEIIAALGATDRLVGVGSFCTFPPEVAALPRLGGLFDPDLEALLRLKPDFVVLRGANNSVEELCKAHGIRIYRDRTESLDEMYATIRELGRHLDRAEAADAIVTGIEARLDKIAAAVAGRERPRVFVSVARRDVQSLAGIMTAGAGSFVNDIVTRAGGENVFGAIASVYPDVSPEAILAARPEVILELLPEAEPDPKLDATVRDVWSKLGRMPAVTTGRVHVLTGDHVLIPSPRVVETVATLARLLHPEVDFD